MQNGYFDEIGQRRCRPPKTVYSSPYLAVQKLVIRPSGQRLQNKRRQWHRPTIVAAIALIILWPQYAICHWTGIDTSVGVMHILVYRTVTVQGCSVFTPPTDPV